MIKKLGCLLSLMAVYVCFPIFGNAQAAPKGGGGAADPEIQVVIPDYGNNYLDIWGNNLSDGVEPYAGTVTLDDQPLNVITATSTNVVVDVVTDLGSFFDNNPPGDYKLVYDSGLQKSRPVEMMLTLGAVGPEGPEGPQGETGEPGPSFDPSKIYHKTCDPGSAECYCDTRNGTNDIALAGGVTCYSTSYLYRSEAVTQEGSAVVNGWQGSCYSDSGGQIYRTSVTCLETE